jgi:hypothetical protein
MSVLCQSRHVQRTARVRQGRKVEVIFKVCWAGKLVIGEHVTGFFDHRGGRRGLRLDPDTIGEAKPTAVRSAADLSAPKRGMCRRPAIRAAVNHL